MKAKQLLILTTILTAVCAGNAQVPFDVSKAVLAKTVMNVRVGGSVITPWYIPAPCGNVGKGILIIPSTTLGRQFDTRPLIDTSQVVTEYWGAAYMPIDYDGIPPLEYMDDIGRIVQCADDSDPFKHMTIDTVACWTRIVNPEYSTDVDGDGYLDIVCDLLGDGELAHVILGGPNAGTGCERVAVIHRHPNRYKSVPQQFFRSSSGRWRMLQWERGQSDLSPVMMLYDVNLKRVGNIFESTFKALDSIYGGSSSLSDDPFGAVEVMVDTVHHKDYLLLNHVVGKDPVTWAIERYDITEGKLTSTGEKVTGYTFFANHNLGHSLGTDVPVIGITSYRGTCYCYADNITTPFARFIPTGTGIQPVAGLVVINDQTGDGKPDMALTGGSPTDGRMMVITFDQSVGVEDDTPDAAAESTARIVSDQLEVTVVAPALVSVDVATVDGRQWPAVAATQAESGTVRYELATLLHGRPAGAYFLRVHIGERVVSVPVAR